MSGSSDSDSIDQLTQFTGRLSLGTRQANALNATSPYKFIHQRLTADKEPLLFVGESLNRSLPIVLATERGSFDSIWASSYTGEIQDWDLPNPPGPLGRSQLCQGIKLALTNAAVKRVKRNTDPSGPAGNCDRPAILTRLRNLFDSIQEDELDHIKARFAYRLDATSLSHDLPTTRNIWFQCPWHYGNANTKLLIEAFIKSAASVQKVEDAVFLGLAPHENCGWDYGYGAESQRYQSLQKLGEDAGYELVGGKPDKEFIQKAILLGYKHHSVAAKDPKQMHKKLWKSHETYVFRKKE